MANGRDGTPQGPSGSRHSRRELANQERLLALGDQVAGRSGEKKKRRGKKRTGRTVALWAGALVIVIVAVVGGSYVYANWRFNKIPKIHVAGEVKPITGKPFNILMIGSDSRAGLSGIVARQTGASTGSVAGQRSDVVKIIHVDPNAGTISMLSIPRDTVVTLLANQTLYGQYNRINVNLGNGPSLLAQTITANFGIPINQTIVVSFAGLINAADALGGVYLNFPYPAFDPGSDLWIRHAGCQLIKGATALAVSRSRHYYYNVHGNGTIPDHWSTLSSSTLYNDLSAEGWLYDGTSDFGRISRQNAFLRAMVDQAKKLYNPLTINSFLSKLPQGITLDQNFSLNELIGLAVRFHSINPNAIRTYTLPTVSSVSPSLGDVLYVDQPSSQQDLVDIFGSQLVTPTNPPPNTAGQTPLPPVVTTTTTLPVSTVTQGAGKKKSASSGQTAANNPTLSQPNYDPTPCTP